MNGFPALDGIPLPAPVWLFKILHVALLALHFVAMQFMMGSLFACAMWQWRGQRPGDESMRAGSRQLTRWLPTVMTFVINLGVPPLLFAQVLYGTSLYTSSVLIGALWISVIAWLILMYSLIYVGQFRGYAGRSFAWPATAALLIGLLIASIYSTNMQLMLRPDVWQRLYLRSPGGWNFPFADHTIWPRWLFMMAGALVIGGLGLLMLAAGDRRPPELRRLFLREGGAMAVVGAIVQIPAAGLVLSNLPGPVRSDLSASVIYRGAELVWLLLWLATVALAAVAAVKGPAQMAAGRSLKPLAIAAPALGVLLTMAMTTVRDGIRDLSLLAAGFDVWAFDVSVNWLVLGIFLLLVVLALGIVGGLIVVALKAEQPKEVALP